MIGKMIRKTTLLVLLCAVALGAAVYYFDWKRNRAGQTAEDASKPAFSIQINEVASLTFTRPAQAPEPPIRLERHNGAWKIVQPIQADADQSRVEGIVEEIASARVSQTEPGSPDRRKAYGLDPPQASVEFELQSGAKHTVLMGNRDFTGAYVYALVDGGPSVALLAADLSTSAGTSVSELRDRRVVHMDAGDVQRVEIHNSNGAMIVSRKKDNAEEWTIEAPEDQKGKPASGWKITDAISGLGAEEVIDRPAASVLRQTASPTIRVVLTGKDGRQSTVRLSTPSGDFVYARADDTPTLYKLKRKVLDDWNLKPADLAP